MPGFKGVINMNTALMKVNVDKSISSLGSIKASDEGIKITIVKNELENLSQLEEKIGDFKGQMTRFTSSYEKNLQALVDGAGVMEDVDKSLASAVKSAEKDLKSNGNNKSGGEGF